MPHIPLGRLSANSLVSRYIGTAYPNVKLVAENIVDIVAAAESLDNVNAVVAVIDDIEALSPYTAQLELLGDVNTINRITSVATSISAVSDVASNIVQVVNVNNNLTALSTVYNSLDLIQDVVDDMAKITTVSTGMSDITAVANNMTSVNALAPNINFVPTVATRVTELEIVANAIDSVEDVANDISAVGVVSTNVADVKTVADNIDAVIAASGLQSVLNLTLGSPSEVGVTYTTLRSALNYADANLSPNGLVVITVDENTYTDTNTTPVVWDRSKNIHIEGVSSGTSIINQEITLPITNGSITCRNVTINCTGLGPALEAKSTKVDLQSSVLSTTGGASLSCEYSKVVTTGSTLVGVTAAMIATRFSDVFATTTVLESTNTGLSPLVTAQYKSELYFDICTFNMADNGATESKAIYADRATNVYLDAPTFNANVDVDPYSPSEGVTGNKGSLITDL